MAVEHPDLVDPYIHEPKGVGAATIGTVYVANGSGSGAWAKIGTDSLQLSQIDEHVETSIQTGTIQIQKDFWISAVIPDVSTAGSIYFPIPESCTVVGATYVLGGAISVGNATVTVYDDAGNPMGTGTTVTQSGSAAGDTFTFAATANNEITGPTFVRVTTDGGSTTAQPLFVTLQITVPI